jgi:hypothetical protein
MHSDFQLRRRPVRSAGVLTSALLTVGLTAAFVDNSASAAANDPPPASNCYRDAKGEWVCYA